MEILVTRHGQTEWNVLKKIQGRTDIELNETGKKQAEETAQKLKNLELDLIICSPLKRAKQTADIINKEKNIPIILDDRIAERMYGEFEGKISTDFDLNSFWDYNQNKRCGNVESVKDLFYRVYSFLDDVKEKYKDKKILIVSHGGISVPIQCYFSGIPDIDNLGILCINNCEVVRFSYKDKIN